MRARVKWTHVAVSAAVVWALAAGGAAPAAAGPPSTAHETAAAPVPPPPALIDIVSIAPDRVLAIGDSIGRLTPVEPAAQPGCNTIWYSGCMTGGFVIASRNNGRTWVSGLLLKVGLQGAIAWPRGGALVWGQEALLFTSDGIHWRRAPLPPGGGLAWIDFSSPTDGWAETVASCLPVSGTADLMAAPNQQGLACEEAVFSTSDGARHWREIARSPNDPIRAPHAAVVADLAGPAVYEGGGRGQLTGDLGVLSTANDGRTWAWARVPPGDLAWSVFDRVRGAAGMWALNEVAGPNGYPALTQIAFSRDGGRRWAVVGRSRLVLDLLSVGGEGTLWAVADSNAAPGVPGAPGPWECPPGLAQCGRRLWVSGDGGKAWRALSPPPATVAAITALRPLGRGAALVVALGGNGLYQLMRVTRSRPRSIWSTVYRAGPGSGATRRAQ